MKLLKEKDFIWKVKKINNIESNPIEYWYTVYYERDSARKYYIVPQYPLIDGEYEDQNSEPELYVYFESIGWKLKGSSEKECKYTSINDGYKYD